MPQKQARDGLAILIHHNIVEFYTDQELQKTLKTAEELKELEELRKEKRIDEEEKDIYWYDISLESILMRYRVALFVHHAKQEFKVFGETIIEVLAESGRLTQNEIIDHTIAKIESIKYNDDYHETTDDEKIRIAVKKSLDTMVKERYLSRVSKIDHNVAPLRIVKQPLKNQIRSNSGSNVNKVNKSSSSQTKKKRKIEEVDDKEDEEVSKRKRVEEGITDDMSQVLWRINYDQFARKLRHEKIFEHVAIKLSNSASTVVKKMIQISSPYERDKNDQLSSVIKFKDLYELILDDDEDISETNLERLLEALSDGGIINLNVSQNKGTFTINLGRISELIKRQNTEFIIEQKFGMIASRIFRLLLEKKQLEEKQITQLAMIPAQECRTILYKMLKSGILQLQEVPKSGDHHPTRTFYLWNVDIARTCSRLLDDMFKTVRNLRMKLANERLEALNQIGGGDASNIAPTLSSEQQKLLDRFGKVEARLEYSIIHLMELLMVFENYVQ